MTTIETINYIKENYNVQTLTDEELNYICEYLQRENDYVSRYSSIYHNINKQEVINEIRKEMKKICN